jgi:UDP-N-acetylmuramate: L-alanyl-gamma-D-glutamyl-meso-diaminopimelate ligase
MKSIPKFEDLKRVHIVGVCGTLMGSFAAALKKMGVEVTGSDQNVYPPMSDVLRDAGIELYSGYSAENLSKSKPEVVVIGNVISKGNPEATAVLGSDIPYVSLPEFMEKLLLPSTRNVVVSGTHGKTTTTSMMAHVLKSAGKDPSYFLGGVSHDLQQSFFVSDQANGFFVLEGDEYDTAFWDKVPKFNHYLPDDVVLTSVEFDHADIYDSMDDVLKAFHGLMERVRPGGRVVACTDYDGVRTALMSLPSDREIVSYSSQSDSKADFRLGERTLLESGTRFEILGRDGEAVSTLEVPVFGDYNLMNALAVWIVATRHGVSEAAVQEAFSTYRGVKRRQEVRADVNGVMVIDDFAHHPTAVKATLSGLKARFKDRRLVAVFEPRSATSRRNTFQKEFAQALAVADSIFVAQPFDQSKIPEAERFSSAELQSDIEAAGKKASIFPSVDEGVQAVANAAEPGDVITVLSNGGFEGFIPKLIERLG